MPVRNALPYLDESITSILEQSFGDFEFIIGDDGSTDGSRARLLEWSTRDDRIRLVLGDGGGRGPVGSSNWVANLATAPLVARMDADDRSGRYRLEAEVATMDADPDAVAVGGIFDCIDVDGNIVRPPRRHSLGDMYAAALPFSHGSIMYRRQAFDAVGGYRAGCDYWEDLDLYWRLAEHGRLLVLPEVHYSYRFNAGHSRLAAHRRKVEFALDLSLQCAIARAAGQDYEVLLNQVRPEKRKLHPAVFRIIGTLELWSKKRPNILPRLIKYGQLRFDRETIGAIGWGTWAFLFPGSLRATANLIARNRESGFTGQTDRPYEWRPTRRPE